MMTVRADYGRITVHGHAGYAPKGQDIVCSAASILLYTLAASLGDDLHDVKIEEGDSRLTWRVNKKNNQTQATILQGFRLLAGTYPDHVTFVDERKVVG